MRIEKFTESELFSAGVSSLSNRPTAPYAFGGEGMTPSALRERFDRLPRLIAERLNLLIGLFDRTPSLDDPAGDSLAEALRSGLGGEHSLADFFRELLSGEAAGYIRVGDFSLADALAEKEPIFRVREVRGESEVLLSDGEELRLGEIGELRVVLPEAPSERYAATLVFDTGGQNGDASLVTSEGVRWSGDDIVGGSPLLFADRHYTCMLWYDGSYEGIVRSVPR
ncbi:MAG: hypothetical protein IKT72_01155 [Clostridia bacterium]|nr:hypothetical protein [Clostridia bacterium]